MMMKPGIPMKPGWKELQGMISMIRSTEEVEITCGECYDQLEIFSEQHLAGLSPAQMIPLVKKHLDRCMDCREEYELLLTALKTCF